LVNLKTKSAGDGYPKRAIEKTVLRFLGSRTFLHGLGRFETLFWLAAQSPTGGLAQVPPLISTLPSSVNWRRRHFLSAMLSKRVRWR
jgi:hypothetical protein